MVRLPVGGYYCGVGLVIASFPDHVNICLQFGNWTCTTHITTVNDEHCRVSLSKVAAHTLHNVVAVLS